MQHLGPCSAEHVELESPRYLPQALKRGEESKRTVIASFRDGSISAYGNVICDRRALYELLGAEDDRNAYSKLIDAIRRAELLGAEVGSSDESFKDYYERVESVESFVARLPATRFYECDAGPYLTGSVIIACSHGVCNASIHRMLRLDSSFAVRVVPRHLHRMLREREPLPVAVVLGAHPLVELAAATSPPYGVFELNVARMLGWQGGVCPTPRYSIPVPCDANIVIEGLLGARRASEGPFADILLLCDKVREQPVFKPESVYVRRDAEPSVWQILSGGVEHRLLMGFPREALVWDSVRRSVGREPRVRLVESGGGWLTIAMSFDDIDHAHARLAALAAFAAHPSAKIAIVTLSDINIDNEVELNWAIATRMDPSRDIIVVSDVRGSTLDPTSRDGIGSKVAIIALPRGDPKAYRRARLVEG